MFKRLLLGTMLLTISFVNITAWAGHPVSDLSGHSNPVEDYGDESPQEREESVLEAEGVGA